MSSENIPDNPTSGQDQAQADRIQAKSQVQPETMLGGYCDKPPSLGISDGGTSQGGYKPEGDSVTSLGGVGQGKCDGLLPGIHGPPPAVAPQQYTPVKADVHEAFTTVVSAPIKHDHLDSQVAFDQSSSIPTMSSLSTADMESEKQSEKKHESSAVSGGWAKMSRVWGKKIYDEDITDPNFRGRDRPGWTPCVATTEHDAQAHAARLELQRQHLQKLKYDDATTAQTERSTVASIRDEQAAKIKRVQEATRGTS